MEAFALLMIQNNYEKWGAMIKYTFKEGNKPVFNFRAKYSEAQKKTEIPGLEYIYLDQHPKFETKKWTKANSGQAKLQGILTEGLNTFVDYRDRYLAGRKHDRCIEVEREVLAEVHHHKATFQTSLAPQQAGDYHLFLSQWSPHHHWGHIGQVWRKSFLEIVADKNAPFCQLIA